MSSGVRVVLTWIVGGATLWMATGSAVAFVVAAVIGRSHPGVVAAPAEGPPVLLPAQRTASPTGLRSQPHLTCTGLGRSPSHR